MHTISISQYCYLLVFTHAMYSLYAHHDCMVVYMA
jgi:hypothetical protein